MTLREHRRRVCETLLACLTTLLAGCAALHPFENAPPSSARPWQSPDMPAYSAAL